MDKKKIADKAVQAGNWLANTALYAVVEAKQHHEDDLFNEGYDIGRTSQRKRDVEAAVMAFLDLKVKELDIYNILSKYFGVDSISEASEFLKTAKKVKCYDAFCEYCKRNIGMTRKEYLEYVDGHNLEEQVDNDERLLDMSPEKLKAYLDKQ